jgi:hypothetical protein
MKEELSSKETEIKSLKTCLEECKGFNDKNDEELKRRNQKLKKEEEEQLKRADADNFKLTHNLKEEVKKLGAQLKAKELIHAEELKKMVTNTKADIQHWEQLADQKNTVSHFPFLLTLAFSLTLEENSRLKV